MIALAALLLSLQLGTPSVPPELESAVTGYWTALSQRDKAAALAYVDEESQNAFIRRNEPFIRSWSLTALRPVAADRFIVTVTARSVVQGRLQDFEVNENWIQGSGGWKVQLADSSSAHKRLWQSQPRRPKRGLLRVLPRAMKIHFISPTQTSSILVENGLTGDIEVVRLDYDSTRFQVTGGVGPVASGEIGRIDVRYVGKETAKDLQSEIRVVTRSADGERVHHIPITYNLVSPATRALLGLTRDQAEELRRTDTLRPAPTSPVRYERGRSAGQDPRKRPSWEPKR